VGKVIKRVRVSFPSGTTQDGEFMYTIEDQTTHELFYVTRSVDLTDPDLEAGEVSALKAAHPTLDLPA